MSRFLVRFDRTKTRGYCLPVALEKLTTTRGTEILLSLSFGEVVLEVPAEKEGDTKFIVQLAFDLLKGKFPENGLVLRWE